MNKNLLIFLLLLISGTAIAGDLKPFKSDGCSSFPDGTLKQKKLWLKCCTEHDRHYWLGGTYEQRVIADEALKACVTRIGEPTIALVMLVGVRVGGAPHLPTTFRWGYGWPYPRGYQALTPDEVLEAKKKIDNTPLNTDN